MQNKIWKKELARDFLALGSWIFYVLVLARASIEPYRPFVDQLILAAVPIILFQFLTSKPNYYVSRALVLVVFTSLFYNSLKFTLFAALAGVLLVVAAHFAKNHKSEIVYGLILGAIATAFGYYTPAFY